MIALHEKYSQSEKDKLKEVEAHHKADATYIATKDEVFSLHKWIIALKVVLEGES